MSKEKKNFKVICLTGGPGAGKTSVTDILNRQFANEYLVVQESASVLYKGGFPRAHNPEEMKCVQDAIYHTQLAAEAFAHLNSKGFRAMICDRGTLDGAAYWPGTMANFLKTLDTNFKSEIERYDLIIHLQSPTADDGYDFSNPIRTESASQARLLDTKIQKVWHKHPQWKFVANKKSFIEKVEEVLAILRSI